MTNASSGTIPHRRKQLVRRAIILELISFGWMGFEPVVAIASALNAHSLTLLAFGADGIIELGAAAVVGWRFVVELRSGRDAGEAAERRARRIAAIMLGLLAAYIAAEALRRLTQRSGEGFSTLGLLVALIEIPTMFVLAYAKRRTAIDLGSVALQADAAAATGCTQLASAVVLGMVSQLLFGAWWVDGVTSLIAAAFLLREGVVAWTTSVS